MFLKISQIFKNTSFNRTLPVAASDFLGFKFDLTFLRILKLLHIYIFFGIIYLTNFCILSGSLFIPKHRSIERKHPPEIDSASSFFLVQILKNFYIVGG